MKRLRRHCPILPPQVSNFSASTVQTLRPGVSNPADINNQADYQKRYNGLTDRFDKAKTRLEAVTGEISDKQARQATIEAFLDELKRLDGVPEFQHALWYSLADFMTVYSKDNVRVTFKDGTMIQA